MVPLVAGSLAVHLCATDDDEDGQISFSRIMLNACLHYASVLLAFAGACHWGMQLAEFGIPAFSHYMAIYYLGRYTVPIVFILFGWLGTVMCTFNSHEATIWLLTGYLGLLSSDVIASRLQVTPPWWLRWRGGFTAITVACLFILLLSEQNLYLGVQPQIRM